MSASASYVGEIDETPERVATFQELPKEYLPSEIPLAANDLINLKQTSELITETLTRTSPAIIQGKGAFYPFHQGRGTVIDNSSGADREALVFDGTTAAGKMDRVQLRDFLVKHHAATKYAIHHRDSRFPSLNNVVIDCDDVGYGGFMLGDLEEAPTPASEQAYLTIAVNCGVRDFIGIGVRINSPGTQYRLVHWHVGSSQVPNTVAGRFEKEGVEVIGGQWGAHDATSIGLYDYNPDSGDRPGNTFDGQLFEHSAGKCISFDGITRAIVGGTAKNIIANLFSVTGTVCYFGRAKYCNFVDPIITRPTEKIDTGTGGTACEWSANSDTCTFETNLEGAKAPVVVDPGAVRALKKVKGIVLEARVSDITVAPNLRTMLVDGIQQLPIDFIPVHNGVAWNYVYQSVTDDSFFSFTPPTMHGRLRLISDKRGSRSGDVIFDTENGLTELIGGGSQFGVLGSVPDGTTGANNFTSIFANSADGDIYVEVRGGSQIISILMECV